MAKRAVLINKEISKEELLSYLVDYWVNQPEGLEIWDGKEFDCNKIREGLSKLAGIIDITDLEIFETQSALLRRALEADVFIKGLEIVWTGIDNPEAFVVNFKIVVLMPGFIKGKVPVPQQ